MTDGGGGLRHHDGGVHHPRDGDAHRHHDGGVPPPRGDPRLGAGGVRLQDQVRRVHLGPDVAKGRAHALAGAKHAANEV